MIIKRKEHGLGDWIMAVTAAIQVGLAHKHLGTTSFRFSKTDKPHFDLVMDYVIMCRYAIRIGDGHCDIENLSYPNIKTLGNEK